MLSQADTGEEGVVKKGAVFTNQGQHYIPTVVTMEMAQNSRQTLHSGSTGAALRVPQAVLGRARGRSASSGPSGCLKRLSKRVHLVRY
jgi:hypothetical protein